MKKGKEKTNLNLNINNILQKTIILVFFDFGLIFFTTLITFWVLDEYSFVINKNLFFNLIIFLILLGPIFSLISGQYKSFSRYYSSPIYYQYTIKNFFIFILLIGVFGFLNINLISLKSLFLVWVLFIGVTLFIRLILRDLIKQLKTNSKNKKFIVIYGAGDAGIQLYASIKISGEYKVLSFIDDSDKLIKSKINNVPINPPEYLKNNRKIIDIVLLAIPSASLKRRKEIINDIKLLGLSCLQTPSLEDITSGRAKIDSLKPILIEDLLGRIKVEPKPALLNEAINNKNICITGAGGSIGSELCNQILLLSPKTLVLIDNSEPSLYQLKLLIDEKKSKKIKIIYLLGDVSKRSFLERALKKNYISLLIHSAAYKHVPLVENNPLEGIRNNVFSSLSICQSSKASNVKNVVLISTDKAVRPTNVMGASKRLSEIIFKFFAAGITNLEENKKLNAPVFSIVRFGNVLGSSGSVVPLFKKQIADGGPITLTHDEIIRYFMTIAEASQLVIQTIPLAKNGDLFLLDMKEPVKIRDLAEQMIKLSGLKVKDNKNSDGDIEIFTTGLRVGEKMYEELLVDNKSKSTIHPLIFIDDEKKSEFPQLLSQLKIMKKLIDDQEIDETLNLLNAMIPDWKRAGEN